MRRIPKPLLMGLAFVAGFALASLSSAADPSKNKPLATQRKPEDGELFPDVAPGVSSAKPKPKSTTPTRPAKPQPAKPLPPKPLTTASHPATTQSAAPSNFVPTHRITLVSHRIVDGIPTTEGDKVNIKMELGSITIDQSQVEKMEPLPPKQPDQ